MFKDYFDFDDNLVIFGKTKVFMRLPALEIIEGEYKKRMHLKNNMMLKIQRTWRRYWGLK